MKKETLLALESLGTIKKRGRSAFGTASFSMCDILLQTVDSLLCLGHKSLVCALKGLASGDNLLLAG